MKEIRTDKKLEVERGREQFGSGFIQNDTSSGNWDESKHKRAADGKFGAGGGSGGGSGSGGGGGDEGGGDEGGGGDDDKKKEVASKAAKKVESIAKVDLRGWETEDIEDCAGAIRDFLGTGQSPAKLHPPDGLYEVPEEEPTDPKELAEYLYSIIEGKYQIDIREMDEQEVKELSEAFDSYSANQETEDDE